MRLAFLRDVSLSLRMMTCAALVVAAGLLGAAAACGTTDSAATRMEAGAEADVVRDSGAPREVSSDAGLCDVYAPFDLPEVVSGLGPPGDRISAFLSDDELRVISGIIVDDGDGGENYDLFEAKRPAVTGSFSALRALSDLNTPEAEHSATLSRDFKTIYFYSTRDSHGGPGHIYRSTRPDENGSFAPPTIVGTLDIRTFPASPFLAHHAPELWLTEGDSNASFKIYRASLGADGTPGTPTAAPEFDSRHDDRPVLSFDGLTMYWSSNAQPLRSGDIWVATRASPTDAFGAMKAVDELSSSNQDYPLWLSADQCRLYFSSYGNTPAQQIYVARRRP